MNGRIKGINKKKKSKDTGKEKKGKIRKRWVDDVKEDMATVEVGNREGMQLNRMNLKEISFTNFIETINILRLKQLK